MPPEHLWEDAEGLELWWKKVEDKRSDGRSDLEDSSRSYSDDEDDADGHQPPGMAENDLARYLKNL